MATRSEDSSAFCSLGRIAHHTLSSRNNCVFPKAAVSEHVKGQTGHPFFRVPLPFWTRSSPYVETMCALLRISSGEKFGELYIIYPLSYFLTPDNNEYTFFTETGAKA